MLAHLKINGTYFAFRTKMMKGSVLGPSNTRCFLNCINGVTHVDGWAEHQISTQSCSKKGSSPESSIWERIIQNQFAAAAEAMGTFSRAAARAEAADFYLAAGTSPSSPSSPSWTSLPSWSSPDSPLGSSSLLLRTLDKASYSRALWKHWTVCSLCCDHYVFWLPNIWMTSCNFSLFKTIFGTCSGKEAEIPECILSSHPGKRRDSISSLVQ